MSQPVIWIIDDDRSIRWVLEKTFKDEGFQAQVFEDAYAALEAIEDPDTRIAPNVVITDIRMPGMDGLAFLKKLKAIHDVPVIVMTAHSDLGAAVSSYEAGAFEYLPKPFDIEEAITLANRAVQNQQQLPASPAAYTELKPQEIIGESPAMQEVFRAIGRLSHSHITVLINGESGTGKELVAHALHRHSPRNKAPFIALNMAAIPKELIEAELFGHEKGAFTGAAQLRKGRFEQADGGTLFLDEIGDMPYDTQTRLLRVLAEGEFYRVGGQNPVKINVRIIAATHQDLENLVREGKFREDLFHRLNVIRVHIPRLRDRASDIPMLARHFLQQAGKELNVEVKTLSDDAAQELTRFKWPGNVRQLQNICKWLTVMASGQQIIPADFPVELQTQLKQEEQATSAIPPATTSDPVIMPAISPLSAISLSGLSVSDTGGMEDMGDQWQPLFRQWVLNKLKISEPAVLDLAYQQFEKIAVETALEFFNGRKKTAAEALGWGRNTLTRKLKELQIDIPEDMVEVEE